MYILLQLVQLVAALFIGLPIIAILGCIVSDFFFYREKIQWHEFGSKIRWMAMGFVILAVTLVVDVAIDLLV